MKQRVLSYIIVLSLLFSCVCESGCQNNKDIGFPCYKNVARQCNDDGWVFTFVYEYEKENVDKIDGLVRFYFNGINVRYRYSDDYVESYTAENKDGSKEKHEYRSGVLIWGRSQETAADSAKIDELLENSDRDSLLALDPDSIEFTSLDKEMFFKLMRDALTGKPQAESNNQTYWDLPSYAALTEAEYLDGYKFQVCFLNETGLVDVCYIDVLYQTGPGVMDYVQLSDLVENGKASEDQAQCFREIQKIAKQIESEDSFITGMDQYKNVKWGDIDMQRLSIFLNNINNGDYSRYLND